MSEPSTFRLPSALLSALRHGGPLWRAVRHGDQQVMIDTLLALARRSAHPDAFFLDARPLGPRILVLYSAEGLQALGDCAALDKGPTASIAVLTSGDEDAYEGIMGPARHGPYSAQLALLDAVIKRTQAGLHRVVRRRAREHLHPPISVDTREVQYFTASVILDQIFPAHDWSRAAIVELIDELETNALVVGPALQNAAMRGASKADALRAPKADEVIARYDRVFGELAREERATLRQQRAQGLAEDELARGLCSQLEDEGLSWSDTKALLTTFFAASYETVSTALSEWTYQVARAPATWQALRQATGEDRRRLVKASLYEAVRIITPLPIYLRRAEEECRLEMIDADGSSRTLAVAADQLVIGLSAAPLWDPAVFPDPGVMRLELGEEQRQRIRLAWGMESRKGSDAPNRFCQGFAYSIALLTAAIGHLLDHCDTLVLERDRPIQMYGTRSRRGFSAALRATAREAAEAAASG